MWDNPPTLRTQKTLRIISTIRLVFTLVLCLVPRVQSAQTRPARPFAVIGIPTEVAPIEARMKNPAVTRIQEVVFSSGTIDGTPIVAARAGVGKVNAAIAATLLIDHFSPSAVVFTGTAGAVDPELSPGDVVIGTAIGYHDFGDQTTSGLVRSPTRNAGTGQLDPSFFPADPSLLAAARRAALSVKSGHVREGLIVTGDTFIADPGNREGLRKQLNAAAVEMEGAAVAQVCARFGVPVIVIRSITDHADGSASGSYRQFLDVASRNAADLALATIREMVTRSK
jgi:adenosylhomocysteine nucleosidase